MTFTLVYNLREHYVKNNVYKPSAYNLLATLCLIGTNGATKIKHS